MRVSRILAAIAAATLAGSGAVVAAALQDAPQDARPAGRDPIADLLNSLPPQGAPTQPPATPVEPAPTGVPAPSSPVVVTPPAGETAPADVQIEPDETSAVEVSEVVTPPPAAEPGPRQRRRVAVIQAIDKVTAESMRFEVEVGGRPVRFNRNLIFTARACEVTSSDEAVADAVAYLDIAVQGRGLNAPAEPRQVFRGWMFASSPAVSGLEHPLYDAWVIGCKA